MLVLSRKNRESVVVGGSEGFDRPLKVTVLDMGPMLPLMSNLDAARHARVREAAVTLRALNDRPIAKSA